MQQDQDLNTLTDRFDSSLFILSKHLGPELVKQIQSDLTPGQIFMLSFIRNESQCNVSRLAEKMEVAPSAITVMLDRLESNGLTRRVRGESDRRIVMIELTQVGEEKLDRILAVRKQITQYCLERADTSDLESFISGLESLAAIAQTVDAEQIIEWSGKERK